MTTMSNTGSGNIADWVAQRASTDPDLPAIKQGEQILSYGDLDAASARFATILRSRGVESGDRVAMIMPNVAYFPIVYYAILRVGAIVVPMNPLLKANEITYTWNDSGARVAVVFPLFAEEATKAASVTGTEVIVTVPGEWDAELARTDPTELVADRTSEETAVILYTSGTTGQPKGAELTHDNLRSNVRTTIETVLPMGPGDVIFGGLPLFHSFGQTVGLN
ncbi:MAG TPA: AMP-binding protein, partial [Propionibacteriaceae bacterium]|nr:AMP-binding protein [Propionibacteriaceae bacterium]